MFSYWHNIVFFQIVELGCLKNCGNSLNGTVQQEMETVWNSENAMTKLSKESTPEPRNTVWSGNCDNKMRNHASLKENHD